MCLVCLLAAVGSFIYLVNDYLYSYLIGISITSFLLFAFDKAIAGSKMTRVSERQLLITALIGGTVGALLGIVIFRHKNRKRSFLFRFLLVIVFQILSATAYFVYFR